MKLSIISFTNKGANLSLKIKDLLKEGDFECTLYSACSFVDDERINKTEDKLTEWCKKRFEEKSAIVFIGALGIAVRGIAPSVKDKLNDVPVLVIDENGINVIPVLSGHVGGANEIARKIASILDANAVITTATDINDKFAADLFAKKNDLYISDKSGIAKVSSKILEGIDVRICIDDPLSFDKEDLPEGLRSESYNADDNFDILVTNDPNKLNADLVLYTKEYVLGIGCKKGKDAVEIENFVKDILAENGIDIKTIACVASIDVKKDEKGITEFCDKYGIPFVTYSAEELSKAEGDFESSDFVYEKVGVDNVSERAAVTAAGADSKLVVKKQAGEGKTLAIAKKKINISFG
ncbi:MAG: cobalamin biosynthesis protein [Lachnospiraceae bacterium]|nr:cobalamin biosynthesis protein [Lachnospiraceae bacterium]